MRDLLRKARLEAVEFVCTHADCHPKHKDIPLPTLKDEHNSAKAAAVSAIQRKKQGESQKAQETARGEA